VFFWSSPEPRPQSKLALDPQKYQTVTAGLILFRDDDDTVTVRTLLSMAGALPLINTQDASGVTPLYFAAANGHAAVTQQLIEVRCNIDLQEQNGTGENKEQVQNIYSCLL
jgi:ankyrin repeat protein